MAATAAQLEANHQNAKRSTGPKSEAGKAVTSQNALRHGVLSRRRVLEEESEAEFQALFDGLCHSLKPVGTLEFSLTEKIAVNLWRQERLRRAETATISVGRRPAEIADRVSAYLGLENYSMNRITAEDLKGIDAAELEWCQRVIGEYEKLPNGSLGDGKSLKRGAPLILAQLQEDADEEKLSIEDYLEENFETLADYVDELVVHCRGQIRKAERHPLLLQLAALVRSQKAIPSPEARETFSRYQTSLDNELFKTLKALRENQEWRLSNLEAEAAEVVPDNPHTA